MQTQHTALIRRLSDRPAHDVCHMQPFAITRMLALCTPKRRAKQETALREHPQASITHLFLDGTRIGMLWQLPGDDYWGVLAIDGWREADWYVTKQDAITAVERKYRMMKSV